MDFSRWSPLPLVVFLRYAFRVGVILVQPWGPGYQPFFVYEKG